MLNYQIFLSDKFLAIEFLPYGTSCVIIIASILLVVGSNPIFCEIFIITKILFHLWD